MCREWVKKKLNNFLTNMAKNLPHLLKINQRVIYVVVVALYK